MQGVGTAITGANDVLTRFCAGDEAAVRIIIESYGGAFATVARSIVGSPELVADVVQQTFVKAWRSASTLDGSKPVQPWLCSIARRKAIDVLRGERRPITGSHAPEQDVAVESQSFEHTMQVFDVRQALDELPPEEREVMKMSHLLGMSYTDIANRLGVPVDTVLSRTGRARRRLSVALACYGPTAK
ncbi:MAG: RNA polymerase sigma-70 factor (ECF subfamily) [Ilumatobacter sp.]|jgi:RNA polymerase sigma-70 factor (ECF subfamily)